MRYIIAFFVFALLLSACEKDVSIVLPPYVEQIVVEGTLEEGEFPLVFLTKSQSYYAPVNPETFSNIFIADAEVRVVINEQDTLPLIQLCTANLPDSLRDAALAQIGIADTSVNICLYTSFDPRLIGKAGNTYTLLVSHGNEKLSAVTSIPPSVKLDSIYFKPIRGVDSLSFIYAGLSDPSTKGNAYRWFAQRINKYPNGPDSGKVKDPNYLAPFGNAFDDEFFNGKSFEIAFNRGRLSGSTKADDLNAERGYYKRGDTILVKFTTVDKAVYEYYRTLYNSIGNSGSPFASPANVKTNVNGGLGVWAGYGVQIDTAFFSLN